MSTPVAESYIDRIVSERRRRADPRMDNLSLPVPRFEASVDMNPRLISARHRLNHVDHTRLRDAETREVEEVEGRSSEPRVEDHRAQPQAGSSSDVYRI